METCPAAPASGMETAGFVSLENHPESLLGDPVTPTVAAPVDGSSVGDGPPDDGSPLLRGVFGSAAMLAVVVGFGQVFGMARELFVASQVGVSLGLDALLIALAVPTMLGSLISGGTTAALVPAYAKVAESDGLREARRLVGAVLGWTVVISLVGIAAIVALAGLIIAISGPGLSPAGHDFARSYLPIVAPIIAFTPLADLLSGVCQIHGRFRMIALAWFAGPVASLIVTVVAWPALGLYALAAGWSANAGATFAVFVIGLMRQGLLPRPGIRAAQRGAADLIRHAAPLTASSAILQLNLLADRGVSSTLSAGSLSAIRYGEGLVRSPMNAIAPAWNTAVYPSLVHANRAGSSRSVGTEATLAVRYVIAVFTPLSALGAALAPLAVDVAYRRGAFDSAAAHSTSLVVAALAPLLTFMVAKTVVTSAHNSYRHGALLFCAGILSAVVNLTLDLLFGLTLGAAGISLSTTGMMLINFLFLGWLLGRHDRGFELGRLVLVGARATAAAGVSALPVALVAGAMAGHQPFAVELVSLFSLGIVGLGAYLLVAPRLGLSEPIIVARWLVVAARRKAHPR